MDFMSDQLFDGRRIRILTIVDAFSRPSPAIDVRQSCRGSDVVETLERVTNRRYGKPQTIREDNSPEFICKGLDNVGLPERRDPGLLAGRASPRSQCLHQIVQWFVTG